MSIFNFDTEEEFKKLSSRVRDEIDYIQKRRLEFLLFQLQRCESPIEQLLLPHLLDAVNYLITDHVSVPKFENIRLLIQSDIPINNDKKYRLDFHIICDFEDKQHQFAIECDGHDFHEKTKEQAKRDKQRDRNLQQLGFTVIRFTGSEIWANPSKCANEVTEIIMKVVGFEDYWDRLVQEDLYSTE